MDTNPQYKLEERHEEGNLSDTLRFLDNYGSERLMRKEEACGGREDSYLHKSP